MSQSSHRHLWNGPLTRTVALLFAASLFVASGCRAQEPPPETLALTHVTVVDVRDGTRLVDRTVLVRGDRIAAVGPEPIHPGVSWPIGTAAEGRAAVDSLAEADVDFVKVYTLLPSEAFFAVFREEDTWQTPTLGVRRNRAFLDDSTAVWKPHLRRAPRPLLEEWRGIRAGRLEQSEAYIADARERHADEVYVTGRLDEAGLPILAGSDAGVLFQLHGFALHDELKLLVGAGLTPAEALRAATLGPARFLGAADSLGTVEEGMRADLLLLEADPLADVANTRRLRAVVLGGRLLNREALDRLLEGRALPRASTSR